jgi:hypothetical protein
MKDIILKAVGDCFGGFRKKDALRLFGLLAVIGFIFLVYFLIATPILQIIIDLINSIWWLILPIGTAIILFAVYITQK